MIRSNPCTHQQTIACDICGFGPNDGERMHECDFTGNSEDCLQCYEESARKIATTEIVVPAGELRKVVSQLPPGTPDSEAVTLTAYLSG